MMGISPGELEARVSELYGLAVKDPTASAWVGALSAAQPEALAGIISRLGSTGTTGARLEALREAARAVLEDRLTQRLIETTRSLEAAATRRAKIGIAASVVIGLAGLFVTFAAF